MTGGGGLSSCASEWGKGGKEGGVCRQEVGREEIVARRGNPPNGALHAHDFVSFLQSTHDHVYTLVRGWRATRTAPQQGADDPPPPLAHFNVPLSIYPPGAKLHFRIPRALHGFKPHTPRLGHVRLPPNTLTGDLLGVRGWGGL